MNQEKMGQFIAKCRKELHLTQAQVGEELGVSDKTVSKWEQGTNAPNISLLNPLSELLHVNTTELLNGEKQEITKETGGKELDIPSVMEYYVDIDKKKSKKKMTIITIILILVFISIISVIVLLNNYDNCFVYEVKSVDNGLKVNGIVVFTTEEDFISINSIENISRYDLDKEKAYTFEYALFSNDIEIQKVGNILLYRYSETDIATSINTILNSISIYLSEESNYNLLINDNILNNDELIIKIKYIDINLIERELTIPLKLNKVFSNDKFLYHGGDQF